MDMDTLGASAGAMFKPSRYIFTEAQRNELEVIFSQTQAPSVEVRTSLAKRFGCSMEQIRTWFSNRRQRDKREVRSVDDADGMDEEEEVAGDDEFEELRREAAAASSSASNQASVSPDALRVRIAGAAPLVVVEHPRYVINIEKGMRMLGGCPCGVVA